MRLYECFFVVILTNYVVIWTISKYKILTLLSISKTAKIRVESSLTYYVCWEKQKKKKRLIFWMQGEKDSNTLKNALFEHQMQKL